MKNKVKVYSSVLNTLSKIYQRLPRSVPVQGYISDREDLDTVCGQNDKTRCGECLS